MIPTAENAEFAEFIKTLRVLSDLCGGYVLESKTASSRDEEAVFDYQPA
jgi:hypothetical protein